MLGTWIAATKMGYMPVSHTTWIDGIGIRLKSGRVCRRAGLMEQGVWNRHVPYWIDERVTAHIRWACTQTGLMAEGSIRWFPFRGCVDMHELYLLFLSLAFFRKNKFATGVAGKENARSPLEMGLRQTRLRQKTQVVDAHASPQVPSFASVRNSWPCSQFFTKLHCKGHR